MGSRISLGHDPEKAEPELISVTVRLVPHPQRPGYVITESDDILGLHLHSKLTDLGSFVSMLPVVVGYLTRSRLKNGFPVKSVKKK